MLADDIEENPQQGIKEELVFEIDKDSEKQEKLIDSMKEEDIEYEDLAERR